MKPFLNRYSVCFEQVQGEHRWVEIQIHLQPSKHEGSNLDQLGRINQMSLAHWLASSSRPDPFGQNLPHSASIKSDLGWFCTEWSGPSVKEHNRIWKWKPGRRPVVLCQNWAQWFLHTSWLPDQMHLAKTWPDHPDWIQAGFCITGCNQNASVRSGMFTGKVHFKQVHGEYW